MDTLEKFEPPKDPTPTPAAVADAAPGFIAEKKLPALLGCPPTEPRKVRAGLTEGRDFVRVGNQVCWAVGAVEGFARVLGLDPEVLPELRRAAQKPPLVTLRVLARRVANPHILLATDGTNECRVRVKRKENFRAGMELRAEHVGADLYALVAHCPRFPGKY